MRTIMPAHMYKQVATIAIGGVPETLRLTLLWNIYTCRLHPAHLPSLSILSSYYPLHRVAYPSFPHAKKRGKITRLRRH